MIGSGLQVSEDIPYNFTKASFFISCIIFSGLIYHFIYLILSDITLFSSDNLQK